MHNRPAGPIGSEELAELMFPYYEYAIRAFGPERCMFESNFPVDKVGAAPFAFWSLILSPLSSLLCSLLLPLPAPQFPADLWAPS